MKKDKSEKIFNLMCWPGWLIFHKNKILNIIGIILYLISSSIIMTLTSPYLLYLLSEELIITYLNKN